MKESLKSRERAVEIAFKGLEYVGLNLCFEKDNQNTRLTDEMKNNNVFFNYI